MFRPKPPKTSGGVICITSPISFRQKYVQMQDISASSSSTSTGDFVISPRLGHPWFVVRTEIPQQEEASTRALILAITGASWWRRCPRNGRSFFETALAANMGRSSRTCCGAECRGLVPVARQLAEDLLDPADATDRSVRAAAESLASCHDCLSQHAPFAEERLATALNVALEARRTSFKNRGRSSRT